MRTAVLCLLCLFLFLHPAVAQDVPPPAPPHHPLQALESELEAEKAAAEKTRAKMKDLKAGLNITRSELVELARRVKSQEQELNAIDARRAELAAEETALETDLEDDRAAMARLVLAVQRQSRIPPQAVLLRPGQPLRQAQSALVLQSVLPAIDARAATLKDKLARLAAVQAELADNRERAERRQAALDAEQDKLAGLLEKRKSQYGAAQSDLDTRQSAIKRISSQAENLRDLVAKLEAEEAARRAREAEKARNASAAGAKAVKAPLPSDFPKAGNGQLPVAGTIRTAFGQTDSIGAVAEGMKIAARPGALVVAPMGGVVRYAGPFRQYGQLVILEHRGGLHSLVAGFGKIATVVGQGVSAGEPLGTLGDDPLLYYEVRRGGKPVDPKTLIEG